MWVFVIYKLRFFHKNINFLNQKNDMDAQWLKFYLQNFIGKSRTQWDRVHNETEKLLKRSLCSVPLGLRLFHDVLFGVFVDYITSVDVVWFRSYEKKIFFMTWKLLIRNIVTHYSLNMRLSPDKNHYENGNGKIESNNRFYTPGELIFNRRKKLNLDISYLSFILHVTLRLSETAPLL